MGSAREHLREYGDIFNVCSQLAHIKKRNKCQMMVNTYLFEMN